MKILMSKPNPKIHTLDKFRELSIVKNNPCPCFHSFFFSVARLDEHIKCLLIGMLLGFLLYKGQSRFNIFFFVG